MEIPLENGDFLQVAWLASARYYTGQGEVAVTFAPALTPYLLQLKSKFTSIELKHILAFKSLYSIRIYELMKSCLFRGGIEIEMEELREMFGLEAKLKKASQFRERVLEKAKQEINEHSDLVMNFQELKVGRKIGFIRFSVATHKQAAGLFDQLVQIGVHPGKVRTMLKEH